MPELVKREDVETPLYEARPANIWIDEYLDERQNDLASYVRIIVQRKWLVLSVALLIFTVAAVRTYTAKRLYRSSANIQIDPEQSVLPYKGTYDAVTNDPRYIGTQVQVLKSEALARRIVPRLKLTSDPDKVSQFARSFAANVTVSQIEGTQVLRVAYVAEDPTFAATAVDTLTEEFIAYGFESKRESTAAAKEFLETELSKMKRKLEDSEQRLVNYGRAHGILLPTEQNNVIMQKLTELNQETTRVEAEVLANQYKALANTTLESFPERLRTTAMKDLDSRRSGLEQKLATTSLQFGPKWPEVVTLTQQLAEVGQQLDAEKRRALEQAKVEYELAVGHRDRVAGALASQRRLADQLTQDSIEYNILKREVETDRQLHEGLLQRLKETDVSAGLRSGNVHVIDRPHVPSTPSSPNIPRNLALGLTLGLVCGVMCAFAVHFLDRTIKTPEDVERELRLSFLGAVPTFSKRWTEVTRGRLVPLASHGQSALQPEASAALYWESYRAVRTSLLLSPEGRPRSILVTSAVSGEGKTTTAINLAIALAQTGARTVIVELDLRRPQLAAEFDLAAGGISRYLSGQSQLHTEIRQTEVPNLCVVAAGPVPPNPAELLGSTRMQRALDLLGRHFEYVIVDGPPLMSVTDASVISAQVNGVLLVVAAKTAIPMVQKARNLLRQVDATILGAVITNASIPSPMHDSAGFYGDPMRTVRSTHRGDVELT